MEIIKKMHDTDKAATLYNMLHGSSRLPLKQFDGDVMQLDNYIVYSDVTQEGEVMTCVTMREPDGTTWTTNGPTFVRDFMTIVEACESCGEQLTGIRVVDGKSKKGRTFRTCEMLE